MKRLFFMIFVSIFIFMTGFCTNQTSDNSENDAQNNNEASQSESVDQENQDMTFDDLLDETLNLIHDCHILNDSCPYIAELADKGKDFIPELVEGALAFTLIKRNALMQAFIVMDIPESFSAISQMVINYPDMADSAFRLLRQSSGQNVLFAYKGILNSESYYRKEAIMGLASVGTQESVNIISEWLMNADESTSQEYLITAIRALSLTALPQAEDILYEYKESLAEDSILQLYVQTGLDSFDSTKYDNNVAAYFNSNNFMLQTFLVQKDEWDRLNITFFTNDTSCSNNRYNLMDFWIEFIIPYDNSVIPVDKGLLPTRTGTMGSYQWGDDNYHAITDGLYRLLITDIAPDNNSLTGQVYIYELKDEDHILEISGTFTAQICSGTIPEEVVEEEIMEEEVIPDEVIEETDQQEN